VIYIYETAPVSRVTGSFKINPFILPFFLNTETFKFFLPETEKNIEKWGQVSIEDLKKYAARGPVWGWHIMDAIRYVSPVHLNWFNLKRPPQSWRYLNTNKEVTK
jgi:predicted transcriptional regulator